ncbi:MAG: hypothetical protein M3Y58_10315 [Chloroflexota bacterium]|nr:hypothetical protein [Chloroflexota bacterium]
MGLRPDEARRGETAAVATATGQRAIIGRLGNGVGALAWWWSIVAVAVIAAMMIGAAYQTHPTYDIAIGQRVQDDPLVQDFNTAERQPAAVGGRAYRWTRGESSIVFPGIGRNAATVTLTLAGGPNPHPDVTILANTGEVAHLHLTPDFADYPIAIAAPYLTTGALTLTFQTMPFRALGDRRELGVLVSRVRIQPSGGFTLPPARTALALWGAVLCAMLALLVVGLRGWEAAGVALLVVIGFGLLLARDRLFIALGAGPWLRVASGTVLLAVALRFVMPPLIQRLGIVGGVWEARWLLAAVVGIFAMRLGGLYHPAMIVSDLTFHVHRFDDVIVQHIWYQEIAALYDKNRPVPYPPGAYLLFAPFALIVHNHADLLTVGTQLLDASRILVIGLVVWKATQDRIAATCATLIAGIVPVAFIIFSWGNLTNAVGEWALTLVFAILALGADRLRKPWLAVCFVAVILLALLSHIGVAVTTVALLAAALGLWASMLLRQRRAPWRDRDFLVAVVLTCIAGALAFALFYRIPLTGTHAATHDPALANVPAASTGGRYEIGGPRPDPSIGLNDARTNNPVVAIAGQLWVEGYAFYRLWPLLLAPLGYWLLGRIDLPPSPLPKGEGNPLRLLRRVPSRSLFLLGKGAGGLGSRLCLVCLVWFGVALLFLVVGVLAGRYVRYAMTAIPAVAVGAGVALGSLWQWRWGRGIAIVLLVFSIAATLLVWYGRITRAYHA